jgi:two-component system, LuxR family, response regulator FixJ
MTESIHIGLVDDDSAVLDSLQLYFARHRVETSCFASAEALLASLDGGAQPDCIVSDIRMPGMSGLDLLRRLKERRSIAPLILITGLGDIEMAVAAIKNGAFDFIEKPFDEGRLLVSVRSAATLGRQHARDAAEIEKLRSRFDTLSARQRQVMELATAGMSNKEIASQLDISPKTVENHRAWVMERMDAKSLAELVRIAMKLEERSSACFSDFDSWSSSGNRGR